MVYFVLYFMLVIVGGVIGYIGNVRGIERLEVLGVGVMCSCIVGMCMYVVGSMVYVM